MTDLHRDACVADHAMVPIDFQECPACGEHLGRPAPVAFRRPAPPARVVDRGARVGTTAAKRAGPFGSILVDIYDRLTGRTRLL
jgi:hypothetical protein